MTKMPNKFLYIIVLSLSLSFLSGTLHAGAKVTFIADQAQFDAAVARIGKGKELNLRLAEGKTFLLKQKLTAKANLSIEGNNSTISSCNVCFDRSMSPRTSGDYMVYRLDSPIPPYSLFYDETGKIIPVAESVDTESGINSADSGIKAGADMKAGATVMIPIPANLRHLRNRRFDRAFGYFDCGWQIVGFLLERSDRQYLYCRTLNNCRTGNYSYDKAAYRKAVRFVVYNAEKKPDAVYYDSRCLYVPKSVGRLYMMPCTDFNDPEPGIVCTSGLSLKGVRFAGASGVSVVSKTSDICEISGCEFVNGLGCALRIKRISDGGFSEAVVRDCVFRDCSVLAGYVVEMSAPADGRNHIVFRNCDVTRCSGGRIGYKNPDGGVWVDGNALLEGNVVHDMPRCHMYFNGGRIIARGNLLYNSDAFNARPGRNLSSDWGLVYCNQIYTEANDALSNRKHTILLEKNLLYGAYAYGGDARGIFIDDGRGDVECRDNVILNTQLYSMDARSQKNRDASSVRTRYQGNIATSHYRIAAGPAVKGKDLPATKANRILSRSENVTSNAVTLEKDTRQVMDPEWACRDGKIYVSRELMALIKSSPAWRAVEDFVKPIER